MSELAINQGDAADAPQEIHGVSFLSRHLGDLPVQALLPLAESLRGQLDSGVVAVTAIDRDQAWLVIAVTDDLTARIDAATLLQVGVEALSGKNDEQQEDRQDGARAAQVSAQVLAQGSGPNVTAAADALTAVGEALAAMLDATLRGEAEAVA